MMRRHTFIVKFPHFYILCHWRFEQSRYTGLKSECSAWDKCGTNNVVAARFDIVGKGDMLLHLSSLKIL